MKFIHGSRFLRSVSIVFFLLMLASCAQTRSVRTPVYTGSGINVTLREWVDQNKVQVPMDYAHPAHFAVDDLKYLLATIEYQEKGLFGWSETMRVFSADELYRVTPHLVNAFEQADPGKEILFEVKSAKPGVLFSAERFTNGLMFVKDGKVNCLFTNINVRPEPDLFDGNPRKYYEGVLWALVAKDGQELFEDENGLHHNWIQLDVSQELAEKQRMEKALKAGMSIRRKALQQQSQQLQPQQLPPQQPENWQDWDGDQIVPTRPRPDVYFPDEFPPENEK